MIETLIMLGSLVALAYAFSISSRMFWIFKSDKGMWRWMYGLVSLFLIATYFLFIILTFSFIASFIDAFSILNILNAVVGIFFFSSAALIGAIMKYHLSVMSSTATTGAGTSLNMKVKAKENSKLRKEINALEKELNEAKRLNRLAVSRELKMIELKNKIGRLERKPRKK